MASEFKLPELGEGIDGGDVIEVLVKEGDEVDDGQTLLELETAKATIPVPAPQAGRITKLHVKAGDHVKVGQTLVTFDETTKAATPEKAKDEESPEESSAKQRGRPSREQQAQRTQRVSPKEAGSAHRPKQEEIESPAPAGGRRNVKQDREREPEHAQKPMPSEQKSRSSEPPTSYEEPVAAGPASRRLARELGVDIARVTGTGRGGRITEEDVKAYVRGAASSSQQQQSESDGRGAPALGAAQQAPPLPDFSRWGPIERVPLNSIRRKTGERMSLAWSLIPHVTHCDEADITQCEEFRKRHAERIAAAGAKLTVTAIALKAAALALKKFPQFNSTLDAATGELILKRYYHVGVAVDTERGLIVPVIRDVDKKSLIDIAVDLGGVAEHAKQKKITLEELQGGTFTITNVGGLGGTAFTPIVNYPEVAILGLARAHEQLVMRDGRTENRLMLPLCLSFDHRVIDGAAAARFTRYVAELLEDPFLMML
jgi:pyruvate dehydrogenase E2 component (dihydrolipoamide acetyltransferase)